MSEPLTMLAELDDSDWREAFVYAPFEREDVVEIISKAEGAHDEDNWVGVFKLRDGRYGYLTAGCDYTGWDCQAGGAGEIRDTLDAIIIECCEDDDRKRLGFFLPTVELR